MKCAQVQPKPLVFEEGGKSARLLGEARSKSEELLLGDRTAVDEQHRRFLEGLSARSDRERVEMRVVGREWDRCPTYRSRRRHEARPRGGGVRRIDLAAREHDRSAEKAALLAPLDAEDLD